MKKTTNSKLTYLQSLNSYPSTTLMTGIKNIRLGIAKWYHMGNHMNKGIIKEVIKEFQEGELPEALPREIDISLSYQTVYFRVDYFSKSGFTEKHDKE